MIRIASRWAQKGLTSHALRLLLLPSIQNSGRASGPNLQHASHIQADGSRHHSFITALSVVFPHHHPHPMPPPQISPEPYLSLSIALSQVSIIFRALPQPEVSQCDLPRCRWAWLSFPHGARRVHISVTGSTQAQQLLGVKELHRVVHMARLMERAKEWVRW